jgi:predicted transcriptional regulator of viral defense system
MGMSNQVFYEIYVSSSKRFADFEFEGITYKYIPSKFDLGVISPRNTKGIRITSLERTVVDSIKDFERIGGLEELLNCITSIPFLDENQLIKYLSSYGMQFLYQKTGFILEHYKDQLHLSEKFIDYCKSKIGKSTRYLIKESTKYNSQWKLVVPEDVFQMLEQGGMPLV